MGKNKKIIKVLPNNYKAISTREAISIFLKNYRIMQIKHGFSNVDMNIIDLCSKKENKNGDDEK